MSAKPGPMPDQELDWLIALLKSPRIGIKNNRYEAEFEILSAFGLNTQPTAAQEEKIFQAVVPFLSLNDPNDQQYALLKQEALVELKQFNDTRAIPLILPLLDDPLPNVREKGAGYVDDFRICPSGAKISHRLDAYATYDLSM